MLRLEIRYGYSQAAVLQSVKVGTSIPPSPYDGIVTSEGGEDFNALSNGRL